MLPDRFAIQNSERSRRIGHTVGQATPLAFLTGSLNAAIALGYAGPIATPSVAIVAPPGLSEFAWIISQSFMLVMPGICVILLSRSRLAFALGLLSTFASPALLLADAITFRWIGQPLLSQAGLRVFTDLRSGLAGHVSSGMLIRLAMQWGALSAALLTIRVVSKVIGKRWQSLGRGLHPLGLLAFLCGVTALAALPALCDLQRTRSQMRLAPWRHPICMLGFRPGRHEGKPAVVDVAVVDAEVETSLQLAIRSREHRLRLLAVDTATEPAPSSPQRPDVLVVVVESFRRELLDPDVMPSLWQLSSRGIQCRNHFSGGNATNHGMFSLLSGLEAIWYERPVRFSPVLNRLFRSIGYEIGFFAGHNDWDKFYMDGYINEDQFDRFEVTGPNGLRSDRRAAQRAADFLSQPADSRRPRLALVYLYATHATYLSYAEDRLFQPAADERFLYPFSPSSRDRVWNRYKNSARTVDRFIGSLLQEDRIVIVTGDHGESFLEDATIGHGSRISQFQNMTPAVIYAPGREGRTIESPTFHADLLPTLLSAVGLALSDPNALDGIDLYAASDQELAERTFVTRNYLSDDIALIGGWTMQVEQPFAYRALCALGGEGSPGDPARIVALDAIGPGGQTLKASETEIQISKAALHRWIGARFGAHSRVLDGDN